MFFANRNYNYIGISHPTFMKQVGFCCIKADRLVHLIFYSLNILHILIHCNHI